jgi:hypothetical protein
MNQSKWFRVLAVATGCLVSAAHGSDIPLFAEDALLELNLELPLRELKKIDRGVERPGVMVLADGTRLDVEVKTRGHARLEYCKSAPPIWVNFKKKQVAGTVFAKQKKLKLVTHCRSSKRFDDLVVSEYLNYKILNLMTETSYRARLARITYHDAQDDDTQGPHYAFFIEHKRGLEKRTDLENLTIAKINPSQLNPQYAAPLEVFSFMIGHSDWSALQGSPDDDCCHNAHLFTPPGWAGGDGQVVPVGYDFDLTGTVNPPYGDPPLELRSWKERLYRGWCWGGSFIEDNVELTRQLKGEIEQLVMTESHASERRRKLIWKFLEGYFKLLDNPKRKARMITNACRKLP